MIILNHKKDVEYQIIIGCNDPFLKSEYVKGHELSDTIVDFFARYNIDFSLLKINDGYLYNDGSFVLENGICVSITGSTLEAKKQAFGRMMGGADTAYTYIVSYVGQWKYKSLSPYILEFWTHVPSANSLVTEVAAVNGKIFLSVHNAFQEDCVVKSFLHQLDEKGIPYQLRQIVPADNAKFPEP